MFMNFDFVSDDEEEILENVPQPRNPKLIRARVDLFNEWNDQLFFMRFRMKKETVVQLLESIRQQIETPMRNDAVSPMNCLLLTLRFFATGSFLIVTGDFVWISKATALRCVWRVTQALVAIKHQHIYMPTTPAAVAQVRRKFFRMARFPRVIGTVDGTHVKIQSPGGDFAEVYRNRKNYFSKNVQIIGGPFLEIADIVTRWPGSAHNQTVFNASNICRRLARNDWSKHFIIGDSGYACRSYILSPLLRPSTPAETLYNESLIRTRQSVERLIGVWKRRFPILALGIRVTLETLEKADFYIVACAVLHNIACRNNEGEPPQDPDVIFPDDVFADFGVGSDEEEDSEDERPRANRARRAAAVNVRDTLIRSWFSHPVYEEEWLS